MTFYVSTGRRPGVSRTQHRRFPGAREREMRETRRRLSACVPVRGTFRARILTILRPSVISNQQSRETVAGTSASITVSSVTTLNRTF